MQAHGVIGREVDLSGCGGEGQSIREISDLPDGFLGLVLEIPRVTDEG